MLKLKQLLLESDLHWKAELYKRFPKIFADEVLDERPNGDEEDTKEISGWKLKSNNPEDIPLKDLLEVESNVELVSRSPKEVIDYINKVWGLKVPYGKVYDAKPERYFKYAKLTSSTAHPSVMVNGVIYWGVGRFIAALLRKDNNLKVWNVINTSHI